MSEGTIGGTGLSGPSAELLDAMLAADMDPGTGVHDVREAMGDELDRAADRSELERLLADLAAGRIDPSVVLAMCESRLSDLNGQLAEKMRLISDATTEANAIGAEMLALREAQRFMDLHKAADGSFRLADVAEPGRRMTEAEWAAHIDARVAAGDILEGERAFQIAAYNPDTAPWAVEPLTVRDYLRREGLDVVMEGMDNVADLATAIDTADERLRVANSGNEMLMVKLQALMQARTAVIQMTTNMLKAMDESVDSVVGNLR